MLNTESDLPPIGGVLAPVDRTVGWLARAGLVLSGLMLSAMIALISVEVILRTFFGQSLLIVGEFVGYMLAAFAFLGVGYAARTRSLLRIDTFFSRMPERLRNLLQIFFDVASLGYICVLTYYVIQLVERSHARGVVSVSMLRIPIWVPQAAMAIGALILVLVIVVETIRNVTILRQSDTDGTHVD